MTPNWKRNGFDSREQSLKYMLAKLFENRKKLLDLGLGGPYKSAKITHGPIPELRTMVFFIGNREILIDDRGLV